MQSRERAPWERPQEIARAPEGHGKHGKHREEDGRGGEMKKKSRPSGPTAAWSDAGRTETKLRQLNGRRSKKDENNGKEPRRTTPSKRARKESQAEGGEQRERLDKRMKSEMQAPGNSVTPVQEKRPVERQKTQDDAGAERRSGYKTPGQRRGSRRQATEATEAENALSTTQGVKMANKTANRGRAN